LHNSSLNELGNIDHGLRKFDAYRFSGRNLEKIASNQSNILSGTNY
jgi:hypothetical protein